ncbi:uncharacterized protein AB675_11930 [Cyphellophora attinorum]|uniref:SnoaL-like domain-containing protein n=1 Tax=Cyphellophora attinorum TaxID=1664694 RepID=A0A0N1H3I5_9EURO|nr:uncharacterized protein AB675_11930 [Phialophora attinorum]KPI35004.1 hypothetical protein AB675_11930 [Phialophora attinorum]
MQPPTTPSQSDLASIRTVVNTLLTALHAKNIPQMLSTIHPDAHSLTSHAGKFESRPSTTHIEDTGRHTADLEEVFVEPWDVRVWGKMGVVLAMSQISVEGRVVMRGWNCVVLHKFAVGGEEGGEGQGEGWKITAITDCLVPAEG